MVLPIVTEILHCKTNDHFLRLDFIQSMSFLDSGKGPNLIPTPDSEFVDVRCPACGNTTTCFSHATTPLVCGTCGSQLGFPSGGQMRFLEGCHVTPKTA